MRFEPVHHTVVAMDVAGSGRRDDLLQLRMRADLRAVAADTIAAQSLDVTSLHHADLGDGIRLIVPANVSPSVLLDPFIPNLAAALRRHRAAASDAARLRLRVAVHAGLLHPDAGGWAGAPLVTCARMLDAAPIRRVLAADDRVDLVLAVSDAVYDAVVRHRYVLDPTTFRPVRISEKETVTTIWVHVPGHRVPPGLDNEPPPASRTAPDTPMPGCDRPADSSQPVVSTAQLAQPSADETVSAVFHVHAARDAYTAQHMTVMRYESDVRPEATR